MTQTTFSWADEIPDKSPEGRPAFRNEVIRASAGTGKTFQLSNRYIAIAEVAGRPDEILAATFARKAAGEILDRVVLRLAEAARDSNKLTELAAFLREENPASRLDPGGCLDVLAKIIRNLHRLRISTLDSFFVQIAGSFGWELGLPPGWSIVDEVTDQRLRSLAIQEVLSEDNVSEVLTLLHLLNKGEVSRSVSDQIRRVANELYNLYRETTPDSAAIEMPSVWQSIKRHKHLEEAEWELALSALVALQLPDDKRFQSARAKDLEAASTGDWEKLVSGGFVKVLLEGKGTYYNKPLPPGMEAVYAPIIEHLKSQLVNRVADRTEATWRLLNHFHQAYARLKNDQRAFRFQDITQLLADAIKGLGPDQLAFRLDAGVGHLLLDEFQDTSLLQWTVLEPFAKNSARDPNSSFFCVGDVKQAIYGWRGGVADLFASLDEQLENLKGRELTKSYRSSQVVIDVVNRVFGGLSENPVMPKLPGVAEVWHKRFQTHSTARDFPGYCVLQTATAANEDDSQQAETLRFAAGEVARLFRESPGASIGILVRRNQAVARMIYELRHHHGIEASEEGGNPLLDSAAVQLVLSLLAIADHPGDTIARFHVAHSPLGSIVGFTDYSDADAARRLSSEIRQSLLNKGYGPAIYHWVRELTPFCSQRELTRLLQLVSLAYRYEDHATEEAQDFIESVSVTKVEDPRAADVRVMNIHQSKGLEFDIVVLPELDVPLGSSPPQVVTGRKSPVAPVEAVFRYIRQEELPLFPGRFASMIELHNQQIHNESLCLLYVAMTRAVHALHLIIAPSRQNERTISKTFAGLLRAALHEGQLQNPPNQILYEHGEKNWFSRQTFLAESARETAEPTRIHVKLRPEDKPRGKHLKRQTPSDLEGGVSVHLGDRFHKDSILSRTRRALWHAWLEQVDWLDDPTFHLPSDEELKKLAGQFLHPRLKLDEEITRFHQALDQPAIRETLSRKQYGPLEPELFHDHPIAHREHQVLMYGNIDRLVILKQDGQVVGADVLDFKTDRIPHSDPTALNQLGRYYEPQLAAYCRAVKDAFDLTQKAVSARILFLEAGEEWRLKNDSVPSPLGGEG